MVSLKEKYQTRQAMVWSNREGITVCFTRVLQTYTSTYIESSLPYLSPSFMTQTERCFEEALDQNTHSPKALSVVEGLLSQAKLFHQGIGGRGEEDRNASFMRLEEIKDSLGEVWDREEKNIVSQVIFWGRVVSALFWIGLLSLGTYLYFAMRDRKKKQERTPIKKIPSPSFQKKPLRDALSGLLLEYAPQMIKEGIVLTFDDHLKDAPSPPLPLLKLILRLIFNSSFPSTGGYLFLSLGKRGKEELIFRTNSTLSGLEGGQGQEIFSQAKETLQENFNIHFGKTGNGDQEITLAPKNIKKLNRKMVNLFKGKKKDFKPLEKLEEPLL